MATAEIAAPQNSWRHPSIGMVGMYILIVSEIVFFASLFGMYGYLAIDAAINGKVWPDTHIIEFLPVPLINTIALFSSAVTMHYSHHGIAHNNRKMFSRLLVVTIVLGTIFLGGQAWEYTHAPISLASGRWAQAFFTLTGFHGAHVAGGVIWLGIVGLRGLKGDFNASRHLGVQAATLYWHFVDLVWVFLLLVFYLPYAFGGGE